jgi:hypothetical protein
MGELRNALTKITGIAPRLNKATDEVNDAFRATESLLAKVGIGIDSTIEVVRLGDEKKSEYDHEIGQDYVETTARDLLLTYERISGKLRIGFRIRIGSFITQKAPYAYRFESPVTWDQAPREWKLMGIQKLSNLIQKIADEGTQLAVDAENAIHAVNDLLREVREVGEK